MSIGTSFLEQVNLSFDRAARLTKHEPTLLSNLRPCRNVYYTSFPIKRDNGILTIWVKVYEGPADNQSPLGGYILKVKRDGADVSDNSVSFGNERPFDKTSAREGAYSYNLKFELNDAGEADWEIFLARPGGFPVSPVSKFTTKGDSYRNLVVFIAYFLAR